MKTYTAQQGDCIASIATGNGFFPDTLWNLGDNSALKDLRKDPNSLLPGDNVVIPDLTVKQQSCASGAKYTFKRKGVPLKFNVRLMCDGNPKKNLAFRLIVDGVEVAKGKSDGDGYVKAPLPATAQEGILKVTEADNTESVYVFTLGTVDPIDTLTGVIGRLLDLGYGSAADDPADVISAFQSQMGLTVNGQTDQPTQDKLKEVFGQ
jgi:N-acetylmuramoyl-L-alanine amidase